MPTQLYSSQRCLFKAYDIRGERALFTDSFVRDLSLVFTEQLLKESPGTIVIGHDVRDGSQAIAQQFFQTLQAAGIASVWLGMVTTPIMAFWAHQYVGYGIIATASHSPVNINGIKWLWNGESPSSDDIMALYQALLQQANSAAVATLITPVPPYSDNLETNTLKSDSLDSDKSCRADPLFPRTLNDATIADTYFTGMATALRYIQQTQQPASPQSPIQHTPFKVVIDCLNGATSAFAHGLFAQFSELCSDVIVLNDTPDGTFPKGNPDPTESGRLQELQQAVISHKAAIGFGFDGDGDRLMVVDDQGHIVAPDHLLYLLAQIAIIERDPKSTQYSATPAASANADSNLYHKSDPSSDSRPAVLFDVKCSHHLPMLIDQIGGQPKMSKTGSSIMRKTLQAGDNQVIFAGELSGHFLFNDGYFVLHDDAMYAGVRLLNWLSRQPLSLAAIVARLPSMVNTPDVYLPLPRVEYTGTQQQSVLQKLSGLCHQLISCCPNDFNLLLANQGQSATLTDANSMGLPSNTRLTCIDGIRLDFATGFGVIRPSNTSHSITVCFAGNTMADLHAIQQRFVALCQHIDGGLADEIAKIRPSG